RRDSENACLQVSHPVCRAMRGRPGGVKSGLARFDGGSKAVMRSAFLHGNMAAGPDGFREQHPNI
ncbi:MAG TPA: hypothetical protein PK677_16940, partial [Acidiphilium sp.]|nr:hypothetical protein [Acidiphilium sp.]